MRHNFSKAVIRAAKARAGARCEAVGTVYGLAPGTRCTTLLWPSETEVDHYPLPAHAEGSDGIENAVVCCKTCHSYKTRKFDIPYEAKRKRIANKAAGIVTRKKRPIPSHKAQWPTGRKIQSRSKV